MKKFSALRILNFLGIAAVIFVNGLANSLPLNNLTTGEISDRFEVYFVPAGYVFSIWGLIYVALIAFGIYQVAPSQRQNQRLERIGLWFLLSCLANIAWLFCWHYEQFPLSLVMMLVLLVSLLVIYLRLDIRRARVSTAETWFVNHPFSLYLGWITVATIANVTSLLYYYGWDGWGISPQVWAVIMLAAAGIISALMSITRSDFVFSLVIIWAVIGIAVKHSAVPLVANAAWITAAFVLILMLIGILLSNRRTEQEVADNRQV